MVVDFFFSAFDNGCGCEETKQFAANAHPFGFRSIPNRNNAPLHGHMSLQPVVEQVLEGVFL
jgi:hypothetical protein